MSDIQLSLRQTLVETEFKMKYHGPELERSIFQNTTSAHNKLVLFLMLQLQSMQREIDELKSKTPSP